MCKPLPNAQIYIERGYKLTTASRNFINHQPPISGSKLLTQNDAGKCCTTLWNLNEEDHSFRETEEGGSDEGSVTTRSPCHGTMMFS